ncbi:cell division protein SepF [Egbenema bharatensis]|uniref:cell division protein SepF n=1 Tax=Egbenema bharatensis TaxID=3463334 RepID=UPI003A8452C2
MGLFQRLRDALGLNEEYDEYYYPEEEMNQEPYLEEEDAPRRKALPSNTTGHASNASNQPFNHPSSNVIGLPGLMMEVILMQPRSFEEIPDAVTALRERKAIILNLNYIEVDQAQRCADYVAGGAFAIDGHQQQIGENVFLFTPNFVQITQYSPQPAPPPPPPQFYAPTASVWEPEPIAQREF